MLSLSLPPREPADPPMRAPARLPGLRVHGPDSAGRDAVEAFIHEIYRRRYGARVRHFAPTLVSLQDPVSGELVCAAGYRSAAQGPLFLEHYLEAPVEALLERHTGAAPQRAGIVELGHLAASRAGEGRRLIREIGPHLVACGFQWGVCTLTQELRHLFVRLGIAQMALGRADPAALGAQAADWGRYYEHGPVVVAGQLQQALQGLARRREPA